MMKFNLKHVILCFLMVFSVLLVGVSSVCAQDTNTTNDIVDLKNNDADIGKVPIWDDDIYENNSHIVDFGDTKIDITPLIINEEYLDIENFTYIKIVTPGTFNLIIDHIIYDGNNTYVRISLGYMFFNLTDNYDIISKLKKHDYSNSMMLTRTVHVNSVESYEYACTTPVAKSFSGDMINTCFKIFDKKMYGGVSLAIFSTTLGKTASFSELKEKYNVTFNYNVLFDDAYNFNKNAVWDLKGLGYDVVCIDGHGSTIIGSAEERTEYKWADIGKNMLYVKNMAIKGFNNAIVNRGVCQLDNVTLKDNKMNYNVDRDWGAAILNAGYCVCNNCSFINNYASKGGAIFSQCEIYLNNCTFSNNTGYNSGDNVFNVDKGKVFFNGREIVLDDNNKTWNNGLVTYGSSVSLVLVDAITGVATAVTGFAIGWFTRSYVSVIGGGVAGGVAGFITSLFVNSGYYDINYNVKMHNIILITCCAISGAVSTILGRLVHKCCVFAHDWYVKYQEQCEIHDLDNYIVDDLNRRMEILRREGNI